MVNKENGFPETETSRRFRTSRLEEKEKMRRYAPVRSTDEERNKRRPLLSALKVLTGRSPHPDLPFTEEARNPRWVSHPGFFFLLSLAICSCAPVAAPGPRPVMVEVPIATPIYCQVPKLQPPILAIAALTPDSPPADTVRSYAASVDVLKSAVHERDTILEACALPSTASAPPTISPQPSTAASSPEPHALSKDDSKAAPDMQNRIVSAVCKIVSWPKYLFPRNR